MNEVATRETAVSILPEQVELIRKTIAKEATPDELQLFFYDCNRQGVHPLDKLIHFTKRGGRYVPITSIDFLRMKAGSTKEYAGSDDAIYTGSQGKPGFEAKVAVYRLVQGQRCAWTATARWEEYFPGEAQGHMWKKMPHVMLSKCAEALALRKAFADVLHGLYIREEMDQAEKPAPDTRSLKEKVQAKIVVTSGTTFVPHEIVSMGITPKQEESLEQPSPLVIVPSSASADTCAPTSSYIMKTGRQKGQPITDADDENLAWLKKFYLEKIRTNPPDSRFREEWEEAVLVIEEEEGKRK